MAVSCDNPYASQKNYHIADSGTPITPVRTTLEYRVQEGDTLEEICQAFQLRQAWIHRPTKELLSPGTLLSITPLNTVVPLQKSGNYSAMKKFS